jgi:hypothetical protein
MRMNVEDELNIFFAQVFISESSRFENEKRDK